MTLDNGYVDAVASRQLSPFEQDTLGTLHVGKFDWQYFVDDSKEGIEGGLDSISPVDRGVPVQDLLEQAKEIGDGLRKAGIEVEDQKEIIALIAYMQWI